MPPAVYGSAHFPTVSPPQHHALLICANLIGENRYLSIVSSCISLPMSDVVPETTIYSDFPLLGVSRDAKHIG